MKKSSFLSTITIVYERSLSRVIQKASAKIGIIKSMDLARTTAISCSAINLKLLAVRAKVGTPSSHNRFLNRFAAGFTFLTFTAVYK
jgi:hypothetical protein